MTSHYAKLRQDHDDVTEDGSVFLILELLEGESLEERCVRLGGRLPESVHDGRNVNEEMLSAMTVPVRPLWSILPDVAGTVAQTVDVALAFDKAKRWRDARSMQDAVRSAYRDRTGRRISMAPRLVAPGAGASGMLRPSTEMTAMERRGPAAVKRNVDRVTIRSRAVAVACATGAAAIAAVAVALLHPAYGRPSEVASGTVPMPPAVSLPSTAVTGSTLVDDRSSPPLEVPAVATGAPSASAESKASIRPDCDTPFVVDPITHIKHWKLDCL